MIVVMKVEGLPTFSLVKVVMLVGYEKVPWVQELVIEVIKFVTAM